MSEREDKRKGMTGFFESLQSAMNDLNVGDLSGLLGQYEAMFERFCPYQIGDRVMLSKKLDLDKSSGWYGSRHWLKVGAVGTVKDRDFYRGYFVFMVHFDDESWKDPEGNFHLYPEDSRSLYTMYETRLSPYPEFAYPFFW